MEWLDIELGRFAENLLEFTGFADEIRAREGYAVCGYRALGARWGRRSGLGRGGECSEMRLWLGER